MPFPGPRACPLPGSLDSMCPVIPVNRSGCREQGFSTAVARMAWERGMVRLSGRDGGEEPSVALLAPSATFKVTVEHGVVFQTMFKLCKELNDADMPRFSDAFLTKLRKPRLIPLSGQWVSGRFWPCPALRPCRVLTQERAGGAHSPDGTDVPSCVSLSPPSVRPNRKPVPFQDALQGRRRHW